MNQVSVVTTFFTVVPSDSILLSEFLVVLFSQKKLSIEDATEVRDFFFLDLAFALTNTSDIGLLLPLSDSSESDMALFYPALSEINECVYAHGVTLNGTIVIENMNCPKLANMHPKCSPSGSNRSSYVRECPCAMDGCS